MKISVKSKFSEMSADGMNCFASRGQEGPNFEFELGIGKRSLTISVHAWKRIPDSRLRCNSGTVTAVCGIQISTGKLNTI